MVNNLKSRIIYCLIFLFAAGFSPSAQGEEVKADGSPDFKFSDYVKQIEVYKDPFIPLLGGKVYDDDAIKDKIKLEGILWHAKNPLVVLNGEILKVGDEIEGATIITIEKEKVVLSYNDKTFSLVFWESGGPNQ